jgi:two-component system cell cycle response regulator
MTARVLVVDDVELNVRLLTAKLASEYFEVVSADNGPSALDMVEAELPDIILLDVMMPRMDGFEVCRRLKANPPTGDIPVVMVTALSDVADRLRGLEAGADDFLTKPVNDIALFARVRSLVRLKRMMDELRLREEVCRQFGTADGTEGPVADVSAARILLAAEQGITASRIIDTLGSVAASVVHASSCAEVQGLLDDSVELVIASLSLPDGDPLRLVAQWRANENSRRLPILLMADDSELSRLAKGLDLGANDYILRPIDRNELTARARTQIRRKRLHDRLRENHHRSLSLALIDPLTGLFNRRYVAAHLDGLLARIGAGGKGSALLLFDLDRFKLINDSWGHPAGDEVLCEIAKRALHALRSFDLVGRYGGEEFIVLMPDTNLQIALGVAERLRLAIADKPFTVSGVPDPIPVSISIGVATMLDSGDSSTDLLRRADVALYAAKNAGRNCLKSWPVEVDSALDRDMRPLRALDVAFS